MPDRIDVLDHGFVRLVDSMGSDLSVVRAARVSYDADWRVGEDEGSDTRLIRYLWKNRHTSPFEAVEFQFEVKAPIFVFRQWHRHRTWSFNELSARYRELPEEFYVPDPANIGIQSTDNKQGRQAGGDDAERIAQTAELRAACEHSFAAYRHLIRAGWPRELARSVLPVATYSHMFAKVDLRNLLVQPLPVEPHLAGPDRPQPLDWKKPRRIFVCAHGDLFADNVPDEWILDVFTVMAAARHHTYQVLTKRADRMREFLSRRDLLEDIYANWYNFTGQAREVHSWPPHNVWCGVSAEDQKRADERVPDLLATPAKVRFLSAEPLLGPLDVVWALSRNRLDIAAGFHARGRFSPGLETLKPLDQVIVGGESGRGARPMHPDWARWLREQCAANGAAFFFKQWGAWTEFYDRARDDPDWRNVPRVDGQMGPGSARFHNLAGGCGFHGDRLVAMRNVGKKAAGRLLDGVEHNEFPKVAA